MSCPNLTHYIATLTLLTVCLSVSGHSRRPTTADDILRSAEYQSEEYLSEAVVADLSKVLYNPDYEILGYEGDDFHRLRIHYTTIHRNHTDGGLYNITGALFRRNHSLPVQGTLRIRTMRKSKMPSTLGYQRYILAADVELFGPVRQSESGVIRGTLLCRLYRDGGTWQFDDLDYGNPDFSNHLFFGSFSAYSDTGKDEIVSWGIGRIPNSQPLDHGKEHFLPDTKYLRNGWASYEPALNGNEAAMEEEERTWWDGEREVHITAQTQKVAAQTYRASILHNEHLQQVVTIAPDFLPTNPKDIGMLTRRDMNGDGKTDLLLYLGNDGNHDYYECYLWTGTHYQNIPSFRRIPNPEPSLAAQCVYSTYVSTDGVRHFQRYRFTTTDIVLTSSVAVGRNGRYTETDHSESKTSIQHQDCDTYHCLSDFWIRYFDSHPQR